MGQAVRRFLDTHNSQSWTNARDCSRFERRLYLQKAILARFVTHCASVEAGGFMRLFFNEVINSCRLKVKNQPTKCKRAIKSHKDIKEIEFVDEVAAQLPRYAKYVEEFRGKSFDKVAQAFSKWLADHDNERRGGQRRSEHKKEHQQH